MLGSLSSEQVEIFLKENLLGRLGCTNGKDVYVVPVCYVYDGQNIFAHSKGGLKIDMMRINPAVCLEVDVLKNLANWKSVVVQGVFEEIEKTEEKQEAREKLADHMLLLKLSDTAKPPHLSAQRVHPDHAGTEETIFYRIKIVSKSGRYERQ
jgi:nitroimidazol reductase NimA-like FMN-containing flavoprotein (pyridoxamine 5'-phosphate oxidase superfamily)